MVLGRSPRQRRRGGSRASRLAGMVLAALAGCGTGSSMPPPPARGAFNSILPPPIAPFGSPPSPAPRDPQAPMEPEDLDALLESGWAKAHVTPAPAASGAEFIRRVTLDLVGRIPTTGE